MGATGHGPSGSRASRPLLPPGLPVEGAGYWMSGAQVKSTSTAALPSARSAPQASGQSTTWPAAT